MSLLEDYFNTLHYCLYIIHYKIHISFKKINPFRLIHKLPFQKRRYEKLGIDIDLVVDNIFGDKRFGTSVIIAGGALWGVFSLSFISLSIILYAAIYKSYLPVVYFCISGGISYLISYVFVFRNDKYLKYFKKYDKWTKRERSHYCIITLICLTLTICIFFGALNLSGCIMKNW
jgi:hypothetical protein